MLHEEKLLHDSKNNKKSKSKLSKAEQREEQERLIRQVIENKMDIKGCYSKPTIFDILWVQIAVFPYTLTKYIIWYWKWIYKFNIKGEELGEEEKYYLIRKNLGISHLQFDAVEDHTKLDYLRKELWIKENFKIWKQEQEEEMKKQLADNPRYKSYRRYLKKGGPGRLTFEE
jgi:DnaJ family protein C protein 25